jgi:hypothetical protein
VRQSGAHGEISTAFLYSKKGSNNRQLDHRQRLWKRVTKIFHATPSTYTNTLPPTRPHSTQRFFNAPFSSLILSSKSSSAFRGRRLAPQESCIAAAVTSTHEELAVLEKGDGEGEEGCYSVFACGRLREKQCCR